MTVIEAVYVMNQTDPKAKGYTFTRYDTIMEQNAAYKLSWIGGSDGRIRKGAESLETLNNTTVDGEVEIEAGERVVLENVWYKKI